MARVNPGLLSKIRNKGAFDVTACFSCGVCTAICPLSEENNEFPRRLIRYAMLGLEDKLLGSTELWTCYYCGECTRSCPRQADPGGFMMATRRYAITRYSWGNIASIFYAKTWNVVSLVLLSLLVLLGIWFVHNPANTGEINLLEFIPRETIHRAGLALGVFVGLSALANLIIMYKYISNGREMKTGIAEAVKLLIKILVKEILWQSRYLKCENKNRFYAHMALFWGFLLLFAATGIDYIAGTRQQAAIVLGVIGGIAVMYGSIYFIYKRLEGKEEYTLYNDFTDWAFLWLIFLAGLTGFLIDLFLMAGIATATYAAFVAHLVVVFDLIVTAPFTKFAHAGYRPFALWMQEIFSKTS